MAYEFTETINLSIPNVEALAQFEEGDFQEAHGLIVEVAAVHEGVTANYNFYSASELQKGLESWLKPYPKPIIINHDVYTDPIGRVIGARMDAEEDGTPFVRLQAAITDPVAVERVRDKRYMTGSIGGKAEEAVCSICGVDWAAPSERMAAPCTHRRGNIYKGKVATIEMRNISFKEYSFVNVPADSNSTIRSVAAPVAESEAYVKDVRFFVLDLEKEGLVQCTESESVDILAEMKKKDASSLHMTMKGAFIEAQVVNKIEEEVVNRHINDTNDEDGIKIHSEENVMAKDVETAEDDDILAVTESLSADLAAQPEEDESVEEEVAAEESEVEAEEADAEEADVEEAADAEEAAEEVEEGERPEGQEKSGNKDVDPETSAGAPASRESDEEETAEEISEEASAEEGEDAQEGEAAEETELTEEETSDESRVAELEARVQELEQKNTRLKAALHHTLAERVVDTKISLGLVEADTRSESIEEHASRTASSLADSLRDLAALPRPAVKASEASLDVDDISEAVEDEPGIITAEDEEVIVPEASPTEKAEALFTDILMGRKQA